MNRTAALLLLLLAATAVSAQEAQQPYPAAPRQEPQVTVDPRPGTGPGSQLKVHDYFRGQATFPGTNAGPADVTIRQWSIAHGVRVTRFPEDGFLIIQVRGGHLVTTINGDRRERTDGELFTVPDGTALAVETDRDMAVLEVVAVRRKR